MEIINKEWSTVSTELIQDPNNLNLWQRLVETAEFNEKRGITKVTPPPELELLRSSYRQLLKKFPLLFNYWIRYADWEFKLGNTSRANEIYLEGLQHLNYCIELWISYLQFKMNTLTNNLNEILNLFEQARKLIGYHFHSYEFYKLYLSFLENFQTDSNQFLKKYYVLLRIIIEIPIYHYEYFYKKFFDAIAQIGQEEDNKLISLIAPAKFTYKDNKSLSIELKNSFMGAYITTQFKVYELFNFEKKLSRQYFDVKIISKQQFDTWYQYLEFLELKQYPFSFIELTLHRFLYSTAQYPDSWIKLADFYIFHGKYNSAKQALSRGLIYNGDYRPLIKLIDLEIFLKQYLRARDLLVNYIKFNISIPIPIYEKLLSIESMLNKDDDEYIINLFKQIIQETQNDWFFNVLLNYPIDHEKKVSLFKEFEPEFFKGRNGGLYQNAYNKLTKNQDTIANNNNNTKNETVKSFDEDYELSLNTN
ncbi:uncharacterized protein J8A68_003800 [[Candida] subhashii]|uniref:Pre-mRNA-processing factor 39 n=1 Tax=[Candida] subhashii TaxID=561895 RepID=A0A8J5QLH5_9ASCO|nr:uncharacterized protein J8A68_003800 [[Candida] subhashii]KAG7662670.1 hypothetical protein J8A68_003800 [[Candida] subhashii]